MNMFGSGHGRPECVQGDMETLDIRLVAPGPWSA